MKFLHRFFIKISERISPPVRAEGSVAERSGLEAFRLCFTQQLIQPALCADAGARVPRILSDLPKANCIEGQGERKSAVIIGLVLLCTLVHADQPQSSGRPPLYFCMAADHKYYQCLLNLIGSIHRFNFDDTAAIAVYDIGLTAQQKEQLRGIEKVEVC